MTSKVITDDKEQRKGFKERALQRVNASLTPPEPIKSADPFVPIDIEIPSNFWELSNVELYGIVLYQGLTSEQANRVMEQLRGREPGSREFRIVLQVPKTQESEAEAEAEPEAIVPKISVELPANFSSYRARDQYLYLTKEKALAPENANDIVDIVGGKSPLIDVEYVISYAEETVPVSDFTKQEVVVLAPVSVVLPHNFSSLSRFYKEWSLTKDFGLSRQEALDVLSVLEGKTVSRYVSIQFEDAPVIETPAEEEFPELRVSLPHNFGGWRPQDQFLYLKTERKFTYEQSNDIISAFRGQAPLYNKVIIEIA